MQNIVNAINRITEALQCVVISACGTLASFYLSATAPTTVTVAGTYYKIAGTTVKNKALNFDHANNKLTYTGTKPIILHIEAAISFSSDTNNVVAKGCVAVNGVALTNSEMEMKVLTGSDISCIAIHWEVELEPNDYVELFCTCDNAGAVLTATKMVVLVG